MEKTGGAYITMRKILLVTLVATLSFATGMARADEDKGAMERAGAALDRGVDRTREFFSDVAITTRIKQRLIEDEIISVNDVSVKTIDGVVTLRGEIKNEAVAQRIMDVVRATKGVLNVENKMVLVVKKRSKAQ